MHVQVLIILSHADTEFAVRLQRSNDVLVSLLTHLLPGVSTCSERHL